MTARGRAERDALIRRLAAEGCTSVEIAAKVGCSQTLAREVASGSRQERNRRRAEHWRARFGQRPGVA